MPLFNLVLIAQNAPAGVTAAGGVLLFAFYIFINIAPLKDSSPNRRLRVLNGGCELAVAAVSCFMLELALYLFILFLDRPKIEVHLLIINAITCAGLLFTLLLNGIIRIIVCSKQLGAVPKMSLLFFWWVPVVNIMLLIRLLKTSRFEYEFTTSKELRTAERKGEELCKTKYPLLMVHGIFFRDWEGFNYWGRVPQELIDNGATIFYGNHQSSASVERCASELKECILRIVEETGCEKVNIIAHSKGGLDSRFAISCLEMGGRVASLTTINTPHMGCNYVRKLLNIIPNRAIASMGKKYESLYTMLGDDNPEFFSGLKDLTDKECFRLNGLMEDYPGVLYQSVASRMKSRRSAAFPLNVGYCIIKLLGGGENDGLAPTSSMRWGNFLGVLSSKSGQGISHGDMIDLTRKDVEGFDIFEFYIDLVHRLKESGL